MDASPDGRSAMLQASIRAQFQQTALADKVVGLLRDAFAEAMQAEGIVLGAAEKQLLQRAAVSELLAAVAKQV